MRRHRRKRGGNGMHNNRAKKGHITLSPNDQTKMIETVVSIWLRHGYPLRKYIGYDELWTQRLLTVVDLSPRERRLFNQRGAEALNQHLIKDKQWLFPAVEIGVPLQYLRDTILADEDGAKAVVVAPREGYLRQTAERLIQEIKRRCGVELPLWSDNACSLDMLKRFSVILVGGSHENRFSRDIALRYLCGVVDALIPGPGGHALIVCVGLAAVGHNVIQLSSDPLSSNLVVSCFTSNIQYEGKRIVFPYCHIMNPGAIMQRCLPPWLECLKQFLAKVPNVHPALAKLSLSSDPESAAARVAQALVSGGTEKNYYNVYPVISAIYAARYFLITGHLPAAQYFRAMLFRLADYYLKTPGGASYPSDIDFYIGPLTHYFGLLEHLPIFSLEDRLLLANFLLACMRSARVYFACTFEPQMRKDYRQNHQTFAGRSLFLAAAYFSRYGISDAVEWRRAADRVFSGAVWRRTKFEHSTAYEPLLFEHAASYSAFRGKRFAMFKSPVLRLLARRQMISTDNFFRLVDLGDTGIVMAPSDHSDIMAVLSTLHTCSPDLVWFAREMSRQNPRYLLESVYMLTGLRSAASGRKPRCAIWEKAPLEDSHLIKNVAPRLRSVAFDRLAWRTGWAAGDQYLLVDGFGIGHDRITHAHQSANGILRYNHLGRHWLISNGYGRRMGDKNVARSFREREAGPQDHNMLVLMQDGAPAKNISPAALMALGCHGRIAWAALMVPEYAGVNWRRFIVLFSGHWMLVIDCVQSEMSTPLAGHIEWNCLGRAVKTANGWRLAQNGVYLHVLCPSPWPSRIKPMRSGDWHGVLTARRYPHAAFPPQKLVYEIPKCPPAATNWLATLFIASRHRETSIRLLEESDGKKARFRVEDRQLTLRMPPIRVKGFGILNKSRALELSVENEPY